jgi:superfamily II DNA or RNA helicase
MMINIPKLYSASASASAYYDNGVDGDSVNNNAICRSVAPSSDSSTTAAADSIDYSDALRSSSKLDKVIQTILARKDNGAGKLVFCQFRKEIDTIVSRLQLGGIRAVTSFDGRDNKEGRLNKLASSYDVLVIQIKTGCEGLNLQDKYNEIYFVSPHWNPSVEDQAIARCHRIGQKLNVHVFNFEMGAFDIIHEPRIVRKCKEVTPLITDVGVIVDFELDVEEEFEDVEELEEIVRPMDNYIHTIQIKKRKIVSEVFPF